MGAQGIGTGKIAAAKGKLIDWVAAPGPLQENGDRTMAIANRAIKVGSATAILAIAIFLFASVFRAGTGTHANAVTDVIMAPFFLVPAILRKRSRGKFGVLCGILFAIGALLALDATRFLLI